MPASTRNHPSDEPPSQSPPETVPSPPDTPSCSKKAHIGWWWVVLLWLPAYFFYDWALFPMFTCVGRSPSIETEIARIAGHLILLRAIAALLVADQSRDWIIYLCLYIAIVPIIIIGFNLCFFLI